MDTKFTSGAWRVDDRFPSARELIVKSGETYIAKVFTHDAVGEPQYGNGYYTERADGKANAALIAAAPDLYKACEELVAIIGEGRDMSELDASFFVDHASDFFRTAIRAASSMQKARGSSSPVPRAASPIGRKRPHT